MPVREPCRRQDQIGMDATKSKYLVNGQYSPSSGQISRHHREFDRGVDFRDDSGRPAIRDRAQPTSRFGNVCLEEFARAHNSHQVESERPQRGPMCRERLSCVAMAYNFEDAFDADEDFGVVARLLRQQHVKDGPNVRRSLDGGRFSSMSRVTLRPV